MKLSVYLQENGLTDAEFSALVGVDRSSISRLRSGETRPTWDTAAKIAAATNGAVTPNDFLPFRPEDACSKTQAEAVPMASVEVRT